MFGGADNNVLRYIPLPPPPAWVHRGVLRGFAVSIRHKVAVNGSIKYFEMYPHYSDGWIAHTWTWKMGSCNKWQDGWSFKASELRMENPLHLKLLHDLQENMVVLEDDGLRRNKVEDQSSLVNLRAGHPALSLNDGDVVYILLRAICMDEKWLIAPVLELPVSTMSTVKVGSPNISTETNLFPPKKILCRVAQAIKQQALVARTSMQLLRTENTCDGHYQDGLCVIPEEQVSIEWSEYKYRRARRQWLTVVEFCWHLWIWRIIQKKAAWLLRMPRFKLYFGLFDLSY